MTDPKEQDKDSSLRVMPGMSVDQGRIVKPKAKRRPLSEQEYVAGVLARDRMILGRALTLMESSNPEHRRKAESVLRQLMPHTGHAIRVGITGVPGVGKSTFIEALGMRLVEKGLRVAVLAVDPSSETTGGSILGDKTRMENLSRHPDALIRPTATGSWLGGVARGTRESMLVCEAAGFDVVIVETVGVGQSETQVSSMVDFFLLLMLAGAGDELQGIKRGIIEVADAIAINKADGDNALKAQGARAQYQSALRLLKPATEGWEPRVLTCSAIAGNGIDDVWQAVTDHRSLLERTGQLQERRDRQALYWLRQTLEYRIVERFYALPEVNAQMESLRQEVKEGRLSPFSAAERLLEAAYGAPQETSSPSSSGEEA